MDGFLRVFSENRLISEPRKFHQSFLSSNESSMISAIHHQRYSGSPANWQQGEFPDFLCEVSLLTREDETKLFLQLRKYSREPASNTHSQESARVRIRNRIITANLRLLVSIATRFASPQRPISDVICDGMFPLIRAVELFDPRRGNRFSTYATHAIRNHLVRMHCRASQRREREVTGYSDSFENISATRPNADCDEIHLRESMVREPKKAFRNILNDRETLLISARYGLGDFSRGRTFREIAVIVRLSRERVRILTRRAEQKIHEYFNR
jgi:RNA polymerase sigma factor (sigma-70 family)